MLVDVPVKVSNPPMPIDAFVESLTIEIPIPAATPVPEVGFAPAIADVVAVSPPLALRVRLRAFVKTALSPMLAFDVTLMMFKPTEAPTPTLLELPPLAALTFAVAVAPFVVIADDVADTSPPPAFVVDPVSSAAWCVSLTRFKANAPATPTFAAPAPAFAVTLNVSAGVPVPFIVADSVTPFDVIVEPVFTDPSVSACTRFSAIPAPTAMPPLPIDVALPSPPAVPVVVCDDERVTSPPEVIDTFDGSDAFAFAINTLIPIAAATDTGPSDVDADGVALEPFESFTLFVSAVLSAKFRWPPACLSTVLLLEEDVSGAPAALAVAVALDPSVALAVNDTAPTAFMLRLVCDVVVTVSTASASVTPTAALLPDAALPAVTGDEPV